MCRDDFFEMPSSVEIRCIETDSSGNEGVCDDYASDTQNDWDQEPGSDAEHLPHDGSNARDQATLGRAY